MNLLVVLMLVLVGLLTTSMASRGPRVHKRQEKRTNSCSGVRTFNRQLQVCLKGARTQARILEEKYVESKETIKELEIKNNVSMETIKELEIKNNLSMETIKELEIKNNVSMETIKELEIKNQNLDVEAKHCDAEKNNLTVNNGILEGEIKRLKEKIESDPCLSVSCGTYGTCYSNDASYICGCLGDWSGPSCNVDPCSSAPCGTLGDCQVNAASYSCTCLNGWSGPTCRVSTLDCDFDVDLCTWFQGETDDFDWLRNTGSTSSLNTGPYGDHTTGNGYYMYIEFTSQSFLPGERADLVSTLLAPGHTYCMEIALSMYGSTMGVINVYIKPEGMAEVFIQQFQQETNSPDWYIRNVIIPSQTDNFRIVIAGVRGSSYYSDAAIDDILLMPGAC